MKSQALIDYAVLTCVDRANTSPTPLACLMEYLVSLKAAGWDDESLGEFQRAVLLALKTPLQPAQPASAEHACSNVPPPAE